MKFSTLPILSILAAWFTLTTHAHSERKIVKPDYPKDSPKEKAGSD